MPKTDPQHHSQNVILDENHVNMLRWLERTRGLRRSDVIRGAIRAMFNHAIAQVPTCGDGQLCRCSQMHQYPAPSPVAPGGGIPHPDAPNGGTSPGSVTPPNGGGLVQ